MAGGIACISHRWYLPPLRHIAGECELIIFGCKPRVEDMLCSARAQHDKVECAHHMISGIVPFQQGWDLPCESFYTKAG